MQTIFIVVEDHYRTNPLSLVPGGSVVIKIEDNNRVYVYDKVKNPEAYIRKSLSQRSSRTNPVERFYSGRLRTFKANPSVLWAFVLPQMVPGSTTPGIVVFFRQ
jgi:hypothetical protein